MHIFKGPLYVSEIAPQSLRGFFGTINAVAICVGNLAANIFGLPELLVIFTPFLRNHSCKVYL
jgi:hypothetical protein